VSACVCDLDPPTFYRATRPRARVPHRCEECGHTIARGERYEQAVGVWEGRVDRFVTCCHCLAMRDLVLSRVPCFCWGHGGLREGLVELLSDMPGAIPGLAFAVGRLEIERRRMREARP
jgi:hypothetical protein